MYPVKIIEHFLLLQWLVLNIFWFFNLRDPRLLVIRDVEDILIVISLLLSMMAAHFLSNIVIKRTVYCVSCLLLVMLVINEYRYVQLKEQVLQNTDNQYVAINSRLIIGFVDKAEIKKLVQNGIAGIFLSKRNIEGESLESLQAFLQQLQEERKRLNLPVLLVTTDQEGGPVSRLSPLLEQQPSLDEAVEQKQSILDYGRKQGALLHKLGVNVNFSPVVDLKPPTQPGKLDFYSRIATRAISPDPQTVVDVAGQYIDGLEQSGVTATLKHFPGLARVPSDTHLFSAALPDNIETLENTDLKPFTDLSAKTGAWIMLSHVVLESIDNENPVSTSIAVIDSLIRKKLKIKNVLVTDDLTMGATYNRGFCKSVRQSYATSVNYLLVAYHHEKYYDAVKCLRKRQETAWW